MVQLMPLHPKTPSPLASFKSSLVLPFWQQLTRVGKRPLNRCSVVVVEIFIVLTADMLPLPPQIPSSLASFKSRLLLPFWYWLTEIVLEKRPLKSVV